MSEPTTNSEADAPAASTHFIKDIIRAVALSDLIRKR